MQNIDESTKLCRRLFVLILFLWHHYIKLGASSKTVIKLSLPVWYSTQSIQYFHLFCLLPCERPCITLFPCTWPDQFSTHDYYKRLFFMLSIIVLNTLLPFYVGVCYCPIFHAQIWPFNPFLRCFFYLALYLSSLPQYLSHHAIPCFWRSISIVFLTRNLLIGFFSVSSCYFLYSSKKFHFGCIYFAFHLR